MEASNQSSLSKEQLDLIERYIIAYNVVDRYLRESLRADQSAPFSQLIREYAARYPRWREQDTLRMIGDLRNSIVHKRERSYEYLSVPVPSIVENLERIRDQFNAPERVFPKFQRQVLIFQSTSMLSQVLKSINELEFSQFPIYKQDQFIGLLTENGITRWLAKHSTNVMTLVELNEVIITDVLSQEEKRMNYEFISRNTTVLDAENKFVRNTMLEALLITANGNLGEKLMGIISRWDAIHL